MQIFILNLWPFHLRAISCAEIYLQHFLIHYSRWNCWPRLSCNRIKWNECERNQCAIGILIWILWRNERYSVSFMFFFVSFRKQWTEYGDLEMCKLSFLGGYEPERPSRYSSWLKIGSYHAPKAKHTFRISTEMTQNERVTRIYVIYVVDLCGLGSSNNNNFNYKFWWLMQTTGRQIWKTSSAQNHSQHACMKWSNKNYVMLAAIWSYVIWS